MPNALTKICTKLTCRKEKRLNEFYENRTKPDHRNDICKPCQKEVNQTNQARKAGR